MKTTRYKSTYCPPLLIKFEEKETGILCESSLDDLEDKEGYIEDFD